MELNTGKTVKIPAGIAEKFVLHEQPAPAVTTAAATGLFASLQACLTTLAQPRSNKTDVLNITTSDQNISKRIEEVALDGQMEQTQYNTLHHSGQSLPMGQPAYAIKNVSTAIIEKNTTDLKHGTVADWAAWSLPKSSSRTRRTLPGSSSCHGKSSRRPARTR